MVYSRARTINLVVIKIDKSSSKPAIKPAIKTQ